MIDNGMKRVFGFYLPCEQSFGGLNLSSVTMSATYQALSCKFFHVNLAISLYNTIGEEYTVGHYYQSRELTPKFTRSSVHYPLAAQSPPIH